MTIYTPAGQLRASGRRRTFRELAIGATFECNGNVWTKRSTRTASGIWPSVLPKWSYFGATESVYSVE